jgi:hypothetical protein
VRDFQMYYSKGFRPLQLITWGCRYVVGFPELRKLRLKFRLNDLCSGSFYAYEITSKTVDKLVDQ